MQTYPHSLDEKLGFDAIQARLQSLMLSEAAQKLEVVARQLKEKQDQLQELIDKKNALEEEFRQ